MLENDFDPDGDGFSVDAVRDPAHGSITTVFSNATYAPDDGFSGTDTVTYAQLPRSGQTGQLAIVSREGEDAEEYCRLDSGRERGLVVNPPGG